MIMDLIAYLFSYFGVPVLLLAVVITLSINFGFMAGTISSVFYSLYIIYFVKSIGEPVKCRRCLFFKVFIGLVIFNLFLYPLNSEQTIDNKIIDSVVLFFPSLIITVVIILIIWFAVVYTMSLDYSPFNKLRRFCLPVFRLLRPFKFSIGRINSNGKANIKLKRAYSYAKANTPPKKSAIKEFINTTKKIALSEYAKDYYYLFALHTSELMVKCLDGDDYSRAKLLLENYINNLHLKSGQFNYSTNLIGNALYVGMKTNDDKLLEKVFNQILGKDFKLSDINHKGILYNLACYYSINRDKKNLLECIRYCLQNGKAKQDFLHEEDFKPYWEDKDFVELVGA